MLDISIPKIVIDATSHFLSMVSLMCRPITCVTAHVHLHRDDGYCRAGRDGGDSGVVTMAAAKMVAAEDSGGSG
jgi:hypothetical protein